MIKGKKTLDIISKGITSISFAPLNDYCIFGSKDKYWSFYDLTVKKCLFKVDTQKEIHTLEFHPDGIMHATGHQDKSINIWDIRTQKIFTSIKNNEIDGNECQHIAISNKGYHFAASFKDSNVVKIYDMRKNFSVSTIEFPNNSDIQSLDFDPYGGYLLGAQDNFLNIYSSKFWNHDQIELEQGQQINRCKYGKGEKFMIFTSLCNSRTIKEFVLDPKMFGSSE